MLDTISKDNAVVDLPDEQPARRPQASTARTVGVAGGGQLAQMMVPAAHKLGLRLCVLDPDAACSAADSADDLVVGAYDSLTALRALAKRADCVTFEIERVSASGLRRLESLGHAVAPSATVLETIQDKLLQKHFLRMHGIPTSPFEPYQPAQPPQRKMPCVWKARRDGYDGRGVAIVDSVADLAALPPVPAMLEDRVDIVRELAIMIARDRSGAIEIYPVVEIVMDPVAHVLDTVVAPADVDAGTVRRARELATDVVQALDYVGILAVEFFVNRSGALLVNEISPRPHNSGHYTIEACAVSQFEQHLRAVAGLGLRPAGMQGAAVTFNVLGADGARGQPRYVGFDAASASDGVYVHCYDKPEVRPGRKMAHVTVVDETREAALARAQHLRETIQVLGSS